MKRKKTTENEIPTDAAVSETGAKEKQFRKRRREVKRVMDEPGTEEVTQSRSVRAAKRTAANGADAEAEAPAVRDAVPRKRRAAKRVIEEPTTEGATQSKPARFTRKASTVKKKNAASEQTPETTAEETTAREPEKGEKKTTRRRRLREAVSTEESTAENKEVKRRRKSTRTTPTNARGTAGSGGNTSLGNEAERRRKIKATLAALSADPGWNEFLAEQREVLLRMREELLPNMHSVTQEHLRSGASNVASSSGQHIGDAGSEAEQRDITILRLDKDREKLYEIDAAIERIEKGTYGICEISLEPIPRKRLQVQPFCRLTVKCQEEYEKKYGVFSPSRNRENDDVGFSGLQKVIESTILLDEDEE